MLSSPRAFVAWQGFGEDKRTAVSAVDGVGEMRLLVRLFAAMMLIWRSLAPHKNDLGEVPR